MGPIHMKGRRMVKEYLRPNFYRLHLTYFITVIIISSVILYGSNTEGYHVKYIDAIFLTTSAMCGVGLNTVNLGIINGFQQSVLFVSMMMGDLTLVTISVVLVRRYFIGRKIKEFLQHSKAGRRIAEEVEPKNDHSQASHGGSQHLSRRTAKHVVGVAKAGSGDQYTASQQRTSPKTPAPIDYSGAFHMRGYGSFPTPWSSRLYERIFPSTPDEKMRKQDHDYLSFQPTVDHKGRFQNLTSEQERELGGVEYRALCLLTWLLPLYAAFWLSLIMIIMTPYVAHTNAGNVIRNAQPGNLDPVWWSVFVTVSGYTNTGLSLLNQSMIPLNNCYPILIFTGCAVCVGNTLYPVILRLVIWTLSKVIHRNSKLHHACAFLLHHPRRCYLFLFPAKNTWILFAIQISINLSAWIFWIILQLDYKPIVKQFPAGQRVMDGLYQAVGLRASGFSIVTISQIAPALQIFYLVVMYISVFPILMSVRSTNVYEERSLGQDSIASANQDPKDVKSPAKSQLGSHIRKQLAYDIWWLVLALFLVCIIERDALTIPAPGWSIFSVLFEIFSGYGTVGLSLGVPYDDYSFCGAWHSLSKLILMTVMLRGRHRILPMAIDRAVLLPGKDLMEKLDREHGMLGKREEEAEEEEIRRDQEGGQAEDQRESGVQDPE